MQYYVNIEFIWSMLSWIQLVINKIRSEREKTKKKKKKRRFTYFISITRTKTIGNIIILIDILIKAVFVLKWMNEWHFNAFFCCCCCLFDKIKLSGWLDLVLNRFYIIHVCCVFYNHLRLLCLSIFKDLLTYIAW